MHFTGFAEHRLWECRVFSFKIHAHHKSLVFFRSRLPAAFANITIYIPFACHLFLLLEALHGFERLLGGIGSLWEALGWFGRLWKALQALRGFV